MKKLILSSMLIFVCNIGHSQKKEVIANEAIILTAKIKELEDNQRVLLGKQDALANQLTHYQTSYDRQWNHFSLISSLMLGFLGIVVPLVGFLTFARFKKETEERISALENQIKEVSLQFDENIEGARKMLNDTSKELLINLSENWMHLANIYLNLKEENDLVRKRIYDLSGLRLLIESMLLSIKIGIDFNDLVHLNNAIAKMESVRSHVKILSMYSSVIEDFDVQINRWLARPDLIKIHDLQSILKKNGLAENEVNSFISMVYQYKLIS